MVKVFIILVPSFVDIGSTVVVVKNNKYNQDDYSGVYYPCPFIC